MRFLLIFISLCFIEAGISQITKPISHGLWNSLLKKHVNQTGQVNYKGFQKDSLTLKRYLRLISNNIPNARFWSEDDTKAYWINAYNAFTIQLIIRKFPIESITELNPSKDDPGNTIWHVRFIEINRSPYSLDEIQHRILRRDFSDPRIHFALNCATTSAPKLHNEAFTGDNVNEKLEILTTQFINDPKKNTLEGEQVKLSQVFSRFSADFTERSGSIITYINKYINPKIKDDIRIEFLGYDWSINKTR
jgi:hypothetical protein